LLKFCLEKIFSFSKSSNLISFYTDGPRETDDKWQGNSEFSIEFCFGSSFFCFRFLVSPCPRIKFKKRCKFSELIFWGFFFEKVRFFKNTSDPQKKPHSSFLEFFLSIRKKSFYPLLVSSYLKKPNLSQKIFLVKYSLFFGNCF